MPRSFSSLSSGLSCLFSAAGFFFKACGFSGGFLAFAFLAFFPGTVCFSDLAFDFGLLSGLSFSLGFFGGLLCGDFLGAQLRFQHGGTGVL